MKELFLVALASVAFLSADATGTWSGTLRIGSDGNPRPAHLVLKQEGGELTGTAGPDESEQHPIQNGRAENGTLTFELSTEGAVMKFSLKQEGDEIKGEITREREGKSETATISVKRRK